jgi:SPP1 gp7 family putative phage head morphogenesis protein
MSAKTNVRFTNLARRALYAVRAASRVSKAVLGGKPLDEALGSENAIFKAHKEASKKRLVAASQVDAIGAPVASWRAVLDEKTTPDCRAAHGHNFEVNHPPKLGYPGMVHMHCRCVAGPAIEGAKTLR